MKITLAELLGLNLYLGCLAWLAGFVFQLMVIRANRKGSPGRAVAAVMLTFIACVLVAQVIWLQWPFKRDIMSGFIFLPALVAESITAPLVLRLFGYRFRQILIRQ